MTTTVNDLSPTLFTPAENAKSPAPRALSVVHVVLSLDCGGLERIVVALVREGQRRGQRVTVICLERPGTLAPQVEALGVSVVCLHKRPGIRLEIVQRLKNLLQELRPDVVHTHQIGALFYAGPPASRAGARVIVHTEHGKHYAARRRTRWLGRWAGRYASRFFCVSRDIAKEVAAYRIVPQAKIDVVTNGIDTATFDVDDDPITLRCSLGIPEHTPLIGTVGRLNEVKRQDFLISAVAQLHDAHLLLVGDGPQMGALRDLARDRQVEDRVHFAGYQARPEAYLRTMDVFALTSRSEGTPLAVLEAWAAGLPVVASRVGGLPDLIEEGRTGLLFAPDEESNLVRALASLLLDQRLARRLGDAGREQVRTAYSLERMAADYERHYDELLPKNLANGRRRSTERHA